MENRQDAIRGLYDQIACRDDSLYTVPGEFFPEDYPDAKDRILIRKLFVGLDDIFNDKTEKAQPAFLLSLKNFLDGVRIGVNARIVDQEKDHLDDFVLSGLTFLERSQHIAARTIQFVKDDPDIDTYYVLMLPSFWTISDSPVTREGVQDHIFKTMDSWYDPDDKYYNDNMISLALEAGAGSAKNKLYNSNKFLISQTGNECEIRNLQDNKGDIFSRKYKWDQDTKGMTIKDIPRRQKYRR